jgi:hypothetical protein
MHLMANTTTGLWECGLWSGRWCIESQTLSFLCSVHFRVGQRIQVLTGPRQWAVRVRTSGNIKCCHSWEPSSIPGRTHSLCDRGRLSLTEGPIFVFLKFQNRNHFLTENDILNAIEIFSNIFFSLWYDLDLARDGDTVKLHGFEGNHCFG